MSPAPIQMQTKNDSWNSSYFSPLRSSRNKSTALPTKGELVFSANFESGNLAGAKQVEEHEWELYIRPDSHNDRHRLWFFFKVSNCFRNQQVILSIVNFSKSRSLYREGMSPVVRSCRRPAWQRIPSEQVFYYRSQGHNLNYLLSFIFQFDHEEDDYYFAYCYPYTYTDLQRNLFCLESQNKPYFVRECLCTSVWGRRIDLLTITSRASTCILTSEETLRQHGGKKWVFITSRVHPGESPAQFVVQGFIDFLMATEPKAKLLRENIVFKIIPMLNPDGVFLGNYRCNFPGYDLNREWASPDKLLHPEIFYTKRLVELLHRHPLIDLDVFVDIHAHTNATNSFMYCNSLIHDDSEKRGRAALAWEQREGLFPRLFATLSEDFSYTKTKFDNDSSKEGTGRRELGQLLSPDVHCYTLETSFFAASRAASSISEETRLNGDDQDPLENDRFVPFTPSSYMALGKNLALTFLDFYDLEARQESKAAAHHK